MSPRPGILAVVTALLLVTAGSSPVVVAQRVRILDSRSVAGGGAPFDLVEAFLAVNPGDSDQLIASGMATNAESSIVYASWDGGRSWSQVGPDSGDPRVFEGGDPMVVFGDDGRAYFSTITPNLLVWTSSDAGRTWNGPSRVPGRGYDRQWVAPGRGPTGSGVVYAGAKTRVPHLAAGSRDVVALSISRDGGHTFGEPAYVLPDSGFLNVVSDVLVTRENRVMLPYLLYYGGMAGGPGRAMLRGGYEIRFWSGGDPNLSEAFPVARTAGYANENWDQAMKGLGGGQMAMDESGGQFDGTLYLVWTKSIDDRLQIVIVHSRDGGRTWSPALRVNDGGFRSNHSTPAVAVNSDGVVAVSWYDRRGDASDGCFRPYIAISMDGGQSFGSGTRVSSHQTCPGTGSRWLNGGDTQGLVSLPGGRFRTVWVTGSPNTFELWTALLQVSQD